MLYSYIYFFHPHVYTLTTKLHFKHAKLHSSRSYFCPFYIRIHYFHASSYAFPPVSSLTFPLSCSLLHTNPLSHGFFVCFSSHLFSDLALFCVRIHYLMASSYAFTLISSFAFPISTCNNYQKHFSRQNTFPKRNYIHIKSIDSSSKSILNIISCLLYKKRHKAVNSVPCAIIFTL